jgi:cobalamin biosynthesis Co2+ chelatase CbiK
MKIFTCVVPKLGNDVEEQIRFYLAANPNTPVEALEKLAFDESGDVRSQVAGNANTPIKVLENLATDSYTETLRQLVENAMIPANCLQKIANQMLEIAEKTVLSSLEASVLRRISININTPVETIEKICSISNPNNHYWLLSLGVAQNTQTPDYLLDKLANHDDYDVRLAVANNSNTPSFVLEKLAADKEYFIRQTAINKI